MEQDTSGAFLYTLTLGLISGVGVALLLFVPVMYIVASLVVALVLVVVGSVSKNRNLLLVAIFLAAIVVGVLRAETFLYSANEQSLLPYVAPKAVVEGIVTNDPERRISSLHVAVLVTNINGVPVHGKLLAIADLSEHISYGDSVVFTGKVQEPQPFETNTGRLFDYASYLEVQGISVLMPHATLVQDVPAGFSVQGLLFTVKHYFESSIEKTFPQTEGALLEGILLGERRGIPEELTQAFITSSLVHVVVLSGHNITIVSESVFRVLAFLPRTLSYSVGGVLMVLFALMTGTGATTVRALIMALVALLARYLHRSALALRSLVVAAACMVLWNPPSLLHDTSFILSVLATFGLITLAPWVEKKIKRVPNYKRFDLRSIVATTVAVEIFVTPALLYFSGTFSFFALPANISVLPVVPFAMLSGFVSGLLGLVSPSLALLPALLCFGALRWMEFVATSIQSLPFATARIAQFPVWIVCLSYLPLTLFALKRYYVEQTVTNRGRVK